MEREWEVLRREASLLLPPDLRSFFTLEVGVRASGGDAGGGSGLAVPSSSVVVARRQILDVSTASIVSRRASFGTMSVSGASVKLAAVRRAKIQLFRMPCVTAERTYCRSSRVETMKP